MRNKNQRTADRHATENLSASFHPNAKPIRISSRLTRARKSLAFNPSSKTITKNRSEETFESEQPSKISHQYSRAYKFSMFETEVKPDSCLIPRTDLVAQHLKTEGTTFSRHRKILSVNNRPALRMRSVKSEVVQSDPAASSFIEKASPCYSQIRQEFSKCFESTPSTFTINQLMKDKFSSRRQYETSKLTHYGILPSFLRFSTSKYRKSERHMGRIIKEGAFKDHRVYYENKYIFL